MFTKVEACTLCHETHLISILPMIECYEDTLTKNL